jgi:hypothetical protein
MSGIDHEHTDAIDIAAAWLADNWHVAPQPVTRTLREMFGLGINDAVKAIAEARRIIGRRE